MAKNEKIPFVTYKDSIGLKDCCYCDKGIFHKHIVILDKGIVHYIQGKEEQEAKNDE